MDNTPLHSISSVCHLWGDCRRASSRVPNLLWQFVPVRDYSNAERRLAATGFTLLLVILENMTSKPSAEGVIKKCIAWKDKKAVHHLVHADKITTDSSTD